MQQPHIISTALLNIKRSDSGVQFVPEEIISSGRNSIESQKSNISSIHEEIINFTNNNENKVVKSNSDVIEDNISESDSLKTGNSYKSSRNANNTPDSNHSSNEYLSDFEPEEPLNTSSVINNLNRFPKNQQQTDSNSKSQSIQNALISSSNASALGRFFTTYYTTE